MQEIIEIYLRAEEWGEGCGCFPTFEVHINMWSEDFRRVSVVADAVESRGVPYRMTLDHSHVILKIDNPVEQEVFDIRSAVEAGELGWDPFTEGSICDEWIQRGFKVDSFFPPRRGAAPPGLKAFGPIKKHTTN